MYSCASVVVSCCKRYCLTCTTRADECLTRPWPFGFMQVGVIGLCIMSTWKLVVLCSLNPTPGVVEGGKHMHTSSTAGCIQAALRLATLLLATSPCRYCPYIPGHVSCRADVVAPGCSDSCSCTRVVLACAQTVHRRLSVCTALRFSGTAACPISGLAGEWLVCQHQQQAL